MHGPLGLFRFPLAKTELVDIRGIGSSESSKSDYLESRIVCMMLEIQRLCKICPPWGGGYQNKNTYVASGNFANFASFVRVSAPL